MICSIAVIFDVFISMALRAWGVIFEREIGKPSSCSSLWGAVRVQTQLFQGQGDQPQTFGLKLKHRSSPTHKLASPKAVFLVKAVGIFGPQYQQVLGKLRMLTNALHQELTKAQPSEFFVNNDVGNPAKHGIVSDNPSKSHLPPIFPYIKAVRIGNCLLDGFDFSAPGPVGVS